MRLPVLVSCQETAFLRGDTQMIGLRSLFMHEIIFTFLQTNTKKIQIYNTIDGMTSSREYVKRNFGMLI